MPNLFQRSATWLGDKTKATAGREVTYKRRDTTWTLTAVPTVVAREVIDSDGIKTNVRFVEWSIVAADLAIAPRRGDRLIETLNGELIEWVVGPVDGLAECEWLDSSGLLLCVRTTRSN